MSPCVSGVWFGVAMARRAQRQANAKKARRALPGEPVVDLWFPPPLEDCDETVSQIQPDVTNLITTRLVRWNNQLVDYAVVHSRLTDEGWSEVSSIDCCHGFVHRHAGPRGHDKSEQILPIRKQDDVQYSFNASFDEIYDSYEKGREYP